MDNASLAPEAATVPPILAAKRIPENIWTDRLWLRPLDLSDESVVFNEFCSDPRVTRYMEWKTHRDLSDTTEFIRSMHAGQAQNAAWYWGIALRGSGRLAGMLGCIFKERTVLIGYLLGYPDWGKGYTTEAAGAVVDLLDAADCLNGMLATCHTENVDSMRVLDKLGFERKGIIQSVCPNIDALPQDLYWYWRQGHSVPTTGRMQEREDAHAG